MFITCVLLNDKSLSVSGFQSPKAKRRGAGGGTQEMCVSLWWPLEYCAGDENNERTEKKGTISHWRVKENTASSSLKRECVSLLPPSSSFIPAVL